LSAKETELGSLVAAQSALVQHHLKGKDSDKKKLKEDKLSRKNINGKSILTCTFQEESEDEETDFDESESEPEEDESEEGEYESEPEEPEESEPEDEESDEESD